MRNIAPRDASELEALEQREWLESLDYVDPAGGPRPRPAAARRPAAPCPDGGRRRCRSPRSRPTSTPSAPRSRRRFPGSQEIERRIKSLVRWNAMAMVVRANRAVGRHRRPHLDLRLGGDALRGRLQPLLPRQGRRTATATSSTSRATPRPASTRARSSKAGCRREAAQLPPASWRRAAACRRIRIPWLMPDFWEFPTVSMGLGPIMSIYQARFNRYLEDRGLKKPSTIEGVGVPRRRRDRRAGVARRDHPRGAREARQPDLRHQLQPAAARRPGARQRPDHPGARSDLPRRRLERHQGALGQRLGSAARRRSRRPARQADGRDRRRRVSEVRRRSRAPTSASTSSAPTRGCSTWSSTCPTTS